MSFRIEEATSGIRCLACNQVIGKGEVVARLFRKRTYEPAQTVARIHKKCVELMAEVDL